MLEHLFGSTTRVKLLQIFFASPNRAYFMRELSRLAEVQLNAIRRELANLEKLGIIALAQPVKSSLEETGTERSKYYKLDPKYFLNEELKALLVKAKVLEEQNYIEEIKKRGGDIRYLLLSGTFTGDESAPTDMLLVGEFKINVLSRIIHDLEKFLGRTLRYTLMTEKEYRDRREIGDRFLYGILESKHTVAEDRLQLY